MEGTIEAPSVVDYNVLRSEDNFYFGPGSNNIRKEGENLFVDALNYNLDLDSVNSSIPKDKAISVSPAITEDHCDRLRDATPDIGAFESQY